jgi:RNA polymerase sigma-70 factor (ECF subfamily)
MSEHDEAFDALYRAEWGRLVGALTLLGGDRRIAEELAQETFVRAWARWRRVGRLERPAGWLFTTAFRLHRRRLRRAEHRTTTVALRETSSAGGEAAALDRVVVAAAIAGLPLAQRQAIVARHVLGLSSTEAAAIVGVSVPALRQLLHRAVVTVRTTIETEDAR